jgi:hypothetical protein
LENRSDGVYAYCKFNDTPTGQNAKELVKHGDVNALSIYANRLKRNGNDVLHGTIREVSLVLAGANPGALVIDHSAEADENGYYSEEKALIYSGELLHSFEDDDYDDELDEEVDDEDEDYEDDDFEDDEDYEDDEDDEYFEDDEDEDDYEEDEEMEHAFDELIHSYDQKTQDVLAVYEFTGDTVVPNDPVSSVRHDFQDSVQDIRSSSGHSFSPEKDCIERPIGVGLLNYHDILPLSEERKHADSYVGISQLSASFQFFFKCSIHTTHVPLFMTGNAKAFLMHRYSRSLLYTVQEFAVPPHFVISACSKADSRDLLRRLLFSSHRKFIPCCRGDQPSVQLSIIKHSSPAAGEITLYWHYFHILL